MPILEKWVHFIQIAILDWSIYKVNWLYWKILRVPNMTETWPTDMTNN